MIWWCRVGHGNSFPTPGVKQAFDLKYPPVDNKATSGVYHCVVGTNFACSVTHETHFSCYLTCDNVSRHAESGLVLLAAPQPGSQDSTIGSAGWRVLYARRGRAPAAPTSPDLHEGLWRGAAQHPCERSVCMPMLEASCPPFPSNPPPLPT